jgi:sugar/nucleoside kinase (ribokinase family)
VRLRWKRPGAGPVHDCACAPARPGAGDCFTATFAVAVLEGKAPGAALAFASAAASICVTRKGAMPSMPARPEVEALLSANS